MNPWVGLLKKEFRISRLCIFGSVGFVVISNLIAYAFSLKYGDPGILFVPSIVIVAFHVFYVAFFMFVSLQIESRHLHLWLHTSQSAFRLLGAKLFVGVVGFLVSFLVAGIFAYVGFVQLRGSYIAKETWDSMLVLNSGLIVAGNIVFLSICIAIWLVFCWTVYRLCKQFAPKLGIIMTSIIIVLFAWLENWFGKTALYDRLTKWGYFDIEFINTMVMNGKHVILEKTEHFPLGVLVYYACIAIGLFLLSAWLIDRKVEV
ncbi:hypothetical protein [Thermaerobacillus caldiproteolyticus]|uniref:hypothetical protein n=1 Tax=Thermaerobacillus caldiproteolyticus TaxID=247480 RepID=UPI00188BAF50|nr:hypothetical protein [Anoxybacillus caldiproteolyticus]QPA30315.1 hypothetical protein ISX45_11810 [Anoxybacillus caldiproteolyticus]